MTILAAMPVATLALPIALGCLAVYLLLPRPGALPKYIGAAAGAVALAFVAMFLVPDAARGPVVEAVLFYSFSGLAILGGVSLVTQANPARGAVGILFRHFGPRIRDGDPRSRRLSRGARREAQEEREKSWQGGDRGCDSHR